MASIIFETADTPLALGPICTMPERLENTCFHFENFSVHTTPEKYENATNYHLANLGREITFDVIIFAKLSVFKTFSLHTNLINTMPTLSNSSGPESIVTD